MKALKGLEKFSGGGGGGWVVHKVIIVSVRVLYVGFSGGFQVSGFRGAFRFQVFGVFRFFGRDGTRSSTIVFNHI